MDTEDCISPSIHSQGVTSFNLRNTYVKERSKEHSNDILEGEKICRMCMRVVTCNFTPVEAMNVDTLRRYIPEVDFSSTKESVICNSCVASLATHPNFLNNRVDVNEQVEDVSDDKATESINCEYVEIKSERNYSDLKEEPVEYTSECSYTNFSNCLNLKEEIKYIFEGSATKNPSDFKCENVQIKSEEDYNYAPLRHLKHEPVDYTNECEPEHPTTSNSTLERKRRSEESQDKCHELSHGDSLENQTYKCDSCDYKTDLLRNLTRHQLRHKNIEDMYKCDSCGYKTVYKEHFKQHQLKHKNITDEQMYRCYSCNYKAVRKCYLVRHLVKHKNISEEQLYCCDLCDYKTTRNNYLKAHQLRHRNIPEEQMYTCDFCDYKTLQKKCITQHQLEHEHNAQEQTDLKDEPVERTSQDTYTNFSNCLFLKEEIKDVCEDNPIEGTSGIKCEQVEIKSEENYSYTSLRLLKDESGDSTSEYKAEFAKTTSNSMLKHKMKRKESKDKCHGLNHSDSTENQLYKCSSCDYRTHRKKNLARHQLRHENIPDEQMFQCDSCDYKTIYKPYLTQHQLRHKDMSKEHIYQCDLCNYKTIYRSCIAQHQLKHKDIPEEEMYKCDTCNYKTVNKSHFKIHQQRHKNIPDYQMYQCDSCDYKTSQKRYLTQHQVKHKDISEEYLCYYCEYKTVQKGYLARHLLRHKNVSEEQMYRCDSCNYKTTRKKYLRAHQLRHKNIL